MPTTALIATLFTLERISLRWKRKATSGGVSLVRVLENHKQQMFTDFKCLCAAEILKLLDIVTSTARSEIAEMFK